MPWSYCNIEANKEYFAKQVTASRGKRSPMQYLKKHLNAAYKQLVTMWDLQPVRVARGVIGIYFLLAVVPPYARELYQIFGLKYRITTKIQ